jgi:DNA polymerase
MVEFSMSDDRASREGRLILQVRQYLEHLRWAGVEWLGVTDSASNQLSGAPENVRCESQGGPEQSDIVAIPPRASGRPDALEIGLFDLPQATEVTATLDERCTALNVLAQTVSTCRRCPELAATRTQTVFGVGRPGVELCFVGEAPGADEDAQGEPFVGAAGKLLDKIITACGMTRKQVYICNIIKCRPPGNRTPLPNEIANCREYLEKQLDLVRPKFICALGTTAAQNLLGTTQSMGKLRGRFHSYRGIPVICTYHPAYLLPHRSPGSKKEVWEDMKMLLARMGRTP